MPPIKRGAEPTAIPKPNIIPPAIRKRREIPVTQYFIVIDGVVFVPSSIFRKK